MTERHGEPTRYLIFQLDDYIAYLANKNLATLRVIGTECQPHGPTFEDTCHLTGIGPRHTKAILKGLFDKNYIITNHQIARLKEKQGIDALKLRRFPSWFGRKEDV